MLLYKKDSVPADSAAIICSSYPVNEERFDLLPLKLILYFDDITDALESFRCRIYRNANPEKAQRIPVTSLVRQAKQSKD